MTVKMIGRYGEDRNSTSIAYKKYGETLDDQYPTFSVCFSGDGLYQIDDSVLYTAYGLHSTDYKAMLNGESAFEYDYSPSTRLYTKSIVTPTFKTNFSFKDIVSNKFQLSDIIEHTSLVAENRYQSVFYDKREVLAITLLSLLKHEHLKKPPFYISYQTQNLTCLTRESSPQLDLIRLNDSFTLDTSLLESKTELKIFIHYPGQLVRSFDSPSYTSVLDSARDKSMRFKVSQTTLLRKRSVQDQSCNEDITNHDLFLKDSVTNSTGCILPFWQAIAKTDSLVKECNSPKELKDANEIRRDFKKMLKDYEAPCIDMFSSVVWNMLENWKTCDGCTYIEIQYLEKYYEEIQQSKDFGFQDFISNLGGFIGIFLGYSMLQIPELLGKLFVYLQMKYVTFTL